MIAPRLPSAPRSICKMSENITWTLAPTPPISSLPVLVSPKISTSAAVGASFEIVLRKRLTRFALDPTTLHDGHLARALGGSGSVPFWRQAELEHGPARFVRGGPQPSSMRLYD